jgi:hypothetical protein
LNETSKDAVDETISAAMPIWLYIIFYIFYFQVI